MRMYLLDKKQRVRRWLKDNDFIEAEMTEEINAANQINFSTPLKDRIADNIYYVAIPTPRRAIIPLRVTLEIIKVLFP